MSNLRSDQIIKGSHLMVFMDVEGTLKPIAFATSHTFSKQLNTSEIACKDYGDAAAVVPQNYTWTCQTDNLYSIDGYKQVNDAFKEMQPIEVYFGQTTYDNAHQDSIVDSVLPNWEISGFGEKGQAYITALDVTASAGENATFSATFTGTGTLENVNTPGLAWSAQSATAQIGGTNSFPTLTNPHSVTVSYSSSDSTKATINATSGVISLVEAGNTTISATFAGNDTYDAQTVTYALTVQAAAQGG